ncbi:helix-turn-helix transcriptional regulator [Proteus mirabilis]|uniref:helix-turn-helix domain-containing protein n=1 Tax=Proteus mirabilis TaxID=584 RepID=UPI00311CD8B8
MTMINSTIAHKIKQRRKELRLTGIEMGNRLGISQQHYSRIENGNIKITVELFVFYCIYSQYDATKFIT